MKRLQLLLLLCMGINTAIQAQNWLWAQQSKNDNTYSHSTATDPSGNVYVTGYFTNTVDFDGTSVTTTGGREIYVAKYNGSGVLKWIKTAGCNKPNVFDQGNDIATDASGNVYVIGDFGDTASFDGIQVIATPAVIANATNCFVAKYNTSGVIQWVQPIGSTATGTATGFSIAVDGNNDIVVTGSYFGSTDIDTISVSGGCTNCTNVFVAKFNPSGSALWAKTSNAAALVIDFGRKVVTDPQNNVIIAGQMIGANSFGSTTLNGFGGSDIFVAKYDASGSLLWAREAGSAAYGDDVKGLGTDASGNIYLGGSFTGTSQFGSISATAPAAGSDLFLAKIDPSGSFTWVKQAEASSGTLMNMHTDDNGNSYMAGMSIGAVFGGLNPPMGSFIVKYDNSGAANAYKMMPVYANSFGITLHPSGDIITTGIISGGNPIFNNDTLSGNGFTTNMYVARLDGLTTGLEETNNLQNAIFIYPNPAANEVFIKTPANTAGSVTLTDITGKLLLRSQIKASSGSFVLDTHQLPAGIYLVQFTSGSSVFNQKLVISR
jgi:hypothetical protein